MALAKQAGRPAAAHGMGWPGWSVLLHSSACAGARQPKPSSQGTTACGFTAVFAVAAVVTMDEPAEGR